MGKFDGILDDVIVNAKAAASVVSKKASDVYHHDADIFLLPLFMWQLVPEYKVYLRKHPYVPAWELNFLAVV